MLLLKPQKYMRGFTFVEMLLSAFIATLLLTVLFAAVIYIRGIDKLYMKELQLINEANYVSTWIRQHISNSTCFRDVADVNVYDSGDKPVSLRVKVQRGSQLFSIVWDGSNCASQYLYLSRSSAGLSTLYRKFAGNKSMAISNMVYGLRIKKYAISKSRVLLRLQFLLAQNINRLPWHHSYFFAGKTNLVKDSKMYLAYTVWINI